ncbi:hypothetical protein BKG77_05175 [Mycobacteroides chelonae]|uniref:hypothetical protein n=1 Tax=Mycobacteroides chelonae TaxID=1774 RepID=UPI0008A9544F|nr:hypothetical protein [Mycobacteroides chelonae]OHU23094.1 hypothetical protein BKG77_05175 [Mycobacteroides chelonae]
MSIPSQIYIPDLREIEALELEEHLPPGAFDSLRPEIGKHDGAHGDFGTVTVVVLLGGLAVIRGLSTFIAQRGGREKTKISLVRETDGRVVLSLDHSVVKPSSAEARSTDIESIEARLLELLRSFE